MRDLYNGFVEWRVRILIFIIVFSFFGVENGLFRVFFKFEMIITRKLSILEKNHSSTFLLRMAKKTYKNLFEVKNMENLQFV